MALPRVALQVWAVCLKVVAATALAFREKQVVNLLAPQLVGEANSPDAILRSFYRAGIAGVSQEMTWQRSRVEQGYGRFRAVHETKSCTARKFTNPRGMPKPGI